MFDIFVDLLSHSHEGDRSGTCKEETFTFKGGYDD